MVRLIVVALMFCAGFSGGLFICLRAEVCSVGPRVSFEEAYIWVAAAVFCFALLGAGLFHLLLRLLPAPQPRWRLAVGMGLSTSLPLVLIGYIGAKSGVFHDWILLSFIAAGAVAGAIAYIWPVSGVDGISRSL
jgi:hypothetical protein